MTVVSPRSTGAPKTAVGPATSVSRVIVRSISGASAALLEAGRVTVVVIVFILPCIERESNNLRATGAPYKPERQRANYKFTGDERSGRQRCAVANPELLYASAIL